MDREVRVTCLRGRTSDRTDGAGAGAQALAEELGGRVVGEPSPGRPRDWSEDLPEARPVLEAAAAEISAALDQAELPVLTASDCSICIATLPTVARRVPGVRVLWIDAHGDFNSPGDDAERLPRRHVPGAACGRWDAGWPDTIDPASVHFLGVRELDPGEREDVEAAGVRTGVPAEGPVYVHFDCDGLDPEHMPVQFPVPGGLAPGRGPRRHRRAGRRGAAGRPRGHRARGPEPRRRGRRHHRSGAVSIFITEVEPAGAGTTLAVKDLFDTAGVRTTYGSAIFRDHVPDTTAGAVALLEAGGYAMVGKANLHEFAWGITSENDHYGWVPNPAAPGRVSGGSSGGSGAALAAGAADAALGSDSGGSIRIPAACCGVVGLKVTFGAVPIDGCWPLAPSYDTAGPMARDVEGCERMMEAMAPGYARADLDSLGSLRVGIAWTDLADPLVRARVEEAAALVPVLPAGRPAAARRRLHGVRARGGRGPRRPVPRARGRVRADRRVQDAQRAGDHRRRGRGGRAAARSSTRSASPALMEDLDLIVTPTVPMVAPPAGVGDLELRGRMLSLTFPWNAVGGPALALPCGPAEDGLPASVQLMGRPGEDALVLAAGRLLEAAL